MKPDPNSASQRMLDYVKEHPFTATADLAKMFAISGSTVNFTIHKARKRKDERVAGRPFKMNYNVRRVYRNKPTARAAAASL